jgi:GH25 family lysozyme M1 (1,4-beta-N-acetylmuramidase)
MQLSNWKKIISLILALALCIMPGNSIRTTAASEADMEDPEYYKYYSMDEPAAIDEDDLEFAAAAASSENGVLGCDVSKWQKDIDWNKAKQAGLEFAIIRVGYRGISDGKIYEDPKFKDNITGDLAAGLKVGVYFYSEAITEAEAVEEAKFLISRVMQYNITLPLVIDYEGFNQRERIGQAGLSKEQHTSIVSAFCDKVTNAGYTPMIYGSASFFVDYMDGNALADKYKLWIASYSREPDYYTSATYEFWQFTSKGDGATYGMGSDALDLNYWYGEGTQYGTGLGIDPEVDVQTIYRLYCPVNGEHLYTTDYNEVKVLTGSYGWTYEGIGWYAPTTGTAVYRLYNPVLKNHLYTTDPNEVSVLTSQYGWQNDNNGNPVFYSGGAVPIYRLYNEGLSGMHLLTTDENEYITLPQYGWTQEGIKLYALK